METKPGYLTTEFWVTILGSLYMFLNTTGILNEVPEKYSTFALAILGAAYALSRGHAKNGVKPDAPQP